MIRSAGALRTVWQAALGIALIVSLSCLSLGQQAGNSDQESTTLTLTTPFTFSIVDVNHIDEGWAFGRVGIGTTMPSAELHVVGNVRIECPKYFIAGLDCLMSDSDYITISGGRENAVSDHYSTIGGGGYNQTFDKGNTIGGGMHNITSGNSSTVAGGEYNQTSGYGATVAGGRSNQAEGKYAAIGGGGPLSTDRPKTANRVTDAYGTVAGGGNNQAGDDAGDTVDATYATVSGGGSNTASGTCSTVGGGHENLARNAYSTVAGGDYNTAYEDWSTIGGGWGNTASAWFATISGGSQNTASGMRAAIAGGFTNAAGYAASVGGGEYNEALRAGSVVSGGNYNRAEGLYSVVSGGSWNAVLGDYGSIGGGAPYEITVPSYVSDNEGFAANPDFSNCVYADFGTVSGGANNQAGHGTEEGSGRFATVGGGLTNAATMSYSAVGGGLFNTACGQSSTVGGGSTNTADGAYSTVSGGWGCEAFGDYASILGGYANRAHGRNSLAAGFRAESEHDGSFVWADRSTEDLQPKYDQPFRSTGENQFLIRAAGGVGINTNEPTSPLTVAGAIESTAGGFVFPDGTTQFTAVSSTGSEIPGWFMAAADPTSSVTHILGTLSGSVLELHANGVRLARYVPSEVSTSFVAGSPGNFISEGVVGATISGGGEGDYGMNEVLGDYGTIGGGSGNRAGTPMPGDAPYATVGGGRWNSAEGEYSTVPGGLDNIAYGLCSFAAGMYGRAWHDGTFVWADYSVDRWPDGSVAAWFAFPSPEDEGLEPFLAPNQFLVRATGGALFATAIDDEANVTAGVTLAAGGSSWDVLSDRNLKANVVALDRQEILEKLSDVPVNEWSFVAQDPSIRHVGPMAQDFRAAFGLGTSDRYINSGDLDGIALVSIQALHEITQEQASEIDALRTEIEELRQLVNELCGADG